MTIKQKDSTINKDILILNKWGDYYFKLENNIISVNHITSGISSFESLIISNLSTKDPQAKTPGEDGVSSYEADDTLDKFSESSFHLPSSSLLKLLILFKVKTINNQYRTITPMQIIDLCNISELNQLFIEYWNLKSEDYYLAAYSDIVFTYKILDTNLSRKIISPESKGSLGKMVDSKSKSKSQIGALRFGGYNLPPSMDLTKWGYYQFTGDNSAIVYKKWSQLEYHIQLFDNYQLVDVKLGDKVVLSFKDEMHPKSDLSSFTRTVKNHVYIFKEGELILKQIEKNVSFLTKERKNYFNDKNFLTMDLETRTINGEMTSYCVSIYDGKTFESFYLSDYSNEKEMLRTSILYLMKRKYHNHKIYIHNFSGFDAVFLLTVLSDLSDKVRPVLRDGRYIDLRLDFSDKYKIYFRDSLLLLPGSLRSLAINFNLDNSKGLFPYKFVNNCKIQLDYKGEVPEYKHFDNISLDEYEEYRKEFENKTWDLKKETVKYCKLDCLVLYQIIDKFSDNIFKLFRIDILNYPTLSSLAFAIYRSNFLKKESNIPLIQGEIYDFIKKSYTGGSVDVYKPSPFSSSKDINSKIYRYDVNSLYPYVMKNYPMPVEKPIYFEGDIFILNNINISSLYQTDKPFGIFEVEIETPSNIKIPILQKRIKTNKGYRTIAPIGNWSGIYFSDELYNAQKYGYKFKVIRGYLFKKGNIFSEYVDFLYTLKKKSGKGTPDYIISKLLLNSLYGRLGMSPVCDQHIILSNEEAVKLYSRVVVKNIIDLKNGKELISFFRYPFEDSDNNFDIKNISVVVSAIVTASARIHMTQFKTDKNVTIYYTDTDSIDIDKELDPKFIGEELGQFKLEHVFDEAVFLAPKMYGGKNKSYEYVRIKGLKNPIKYDDLKQLLKKDSKLEIKQEKWYSDVSNGKFHIKDEIYTLMVTDNKRKLLYNEDKIFYDTLPLTLENGEII
uniref:DNA polymerase n=2 Tax=cellular organisms TaxID=131567 RepID=I7HDT2_LENED|nr:dnapol [Lentinula edodes]